MARLTEDHLEQQALDQVILFQAADGQVLLDVRLEANTVWLSQAQMAELFGRERSVISKHIGNVFKEGELAPETTCANFAQVQTEGTRVIHRQVDFYNLDVIISVGYRVKSPRGTQFRIWATQVLRQHLIQGYTLHQRRLQERGLGDLQQALALMARTLSARGMVSNEGQAVLEVVQRYSRAWCWLLAYDEDRLAPAFAEPDGVPEPLGLAEAQLAIDTLRRDLAHCGESTPLFGQENRQASPAAGGPSALLRDQGSPLRRWQQTHRHLAIPGIPAPQSAAAPARWPAPHRRQRHGSPRPIDRRKRTPTERPNDPAGDGPAGGSGLAMTPAQPFALRVFVPSGMPEGMRIAEKTIWSSRPSIKSYCSRLPTAKSRSMGAWRLTPAG